MSELDILVRKYWKDILRQYQATKLEVDGKEYTEKELQLLFTHDPHKYDYLMEEHNE